MVSPELQRSLSLKIFTQLCTFFLYFTSMYSEIRKESVLLHMICTTHASGYNIRLWLICKRSCVKVAKRWKVEGAQTGN